MQMTGCDMHEKDNARGEAALIWSFTEQGIISVIVMLNTAALKQWVIQPKLQLLVLKP